MELSNSNIISGTTRDNDLRTSPELGQNISNFKRLPKLATDRMSIERNNLVCICKLVVKDLIDSSLSEGCMVDGTHSTLERFFIVLEHILFHGLKVKKTLLQGKKDIWDSIISLSKYSSSASDIITSVKEMSNIKTSLGKVRAWLRLALMQKKLQDYLNLFIENKHSLISDIYKEGGLLMNEEFTVISGLLVGLNFIDCNVVVMDHQDYDSQIEVIDYSIYLKDVITPGQIVNSDQKCTELKNLALMLDQKNYFEELNKIKSITLTSLQQKIDTLTNSDILLREEFQICQESLQKLQNENCSLRDNYALLQNSYSKQLLVTQQDISVERQTYEQSRQGLDKLYNSTKKQFDDEINLRLDVEKELQSQISIRQEGEVVVRLLEREMHEKQDTIVSLRKQLNEIKEINISLQHKTKDMDGVLSHKNLLIQQLENKTLQMLNTIKDLEIELKSCNSLKSELAEKLVKVEIQHTTAQVKKQSLEMEIKIEKEWRTNLQKNIDQEKEKQLKFQNEMKSLFDAKREYDALFVRHKQLQQLCDDQEKALFELGAQLSQSKLKVEDLREEQSVTKDAQWADDKEVNECKQCSILFSLSRRKHHCRNCGEIFCNECSNIKLPLPSFPKPVRVCDTCSKKLLNRYSIQ